MKIKIYTVGGTIDKVYFDRKSTFEVGEPKIGEILAEANVAFDFEMDAILHKDSLDMTDDDRRLIAERVGADPCRHILLTHGTDTMIETARELRGIPDKVIVLTGAMQPARFKSSDAAFNIGCAVAAVQTMPPGAYIAMNGCIFTPDNLVKNRSLNRFEKPAAEARAPLSKSARKIQEAILGHGLSARVIEMRETTRTAEDAARAVGCRVGQIVKSLVFEGVVSGRPYLVVASGANRVDIPKFEKIVAEKVKMAAPDFVRRTTGYVIGGVPPLGHAEKMAVFIDGDLARQGRIWAAAGTPRALFPLTFDDLVKITGGRVVSIA